MIEAPIQPPESAGFTPVQRNYLDGLMAGVAQRRLHLFVGFAGGQFTAEPKPGSAPEIILATAHPAKFPDALEAIARVRPPLPQRLGRLLTERERITPLPNDPAAIEAYVERHARAAAKGARA